MNWMKTSFLFCLLIPAAISCQSQPSKTVLKDGDIREAGKSVRVIYREGNKVFLVTCPLEHGEVNDHIVDDETEVLSRKKCNSDKAARDGRKKPLVETMAFSDYKAKLAEVVGSKAAPDSADIAKLDADIEKLRKKLDKLVALSVGDGSQSKSINEQMNTVGEQLEALTIQKESESARVNSSKLFDKLLSYLESTNNVAFNIAETEAGQLLLPFGDAANESEIQSEEVTQSVRPPNSEPLKNSVGMSFVNIKAGQFIGRVDLTDRKHEVTISKSFEMQTTEVTQAQWFKLMKSNPSSKKSDCFEDQEGSGWNSICANHPVENVTWHQAMNFIAKLNDLNDGYVYDLPTTAQWDYAVRGGDPKYSEGKVQNADAQAWYHENANGTTHIVGLKTPNGFGLYDMFGNVSEWTASRFPDPEYIEQAQAVTDPHIPFDDRKKENFMVRRGGDYRHTERDLMTGEGLLSTANNCCSGFRTIRRKSTLR